MISPFNNMAKQSLAACFSLVVLISVGHNMVNGQVPPAIFIFGDSTVDVGTNNLLASGARADFSPNGIDFPYSLPSGRFSNGFNSADQIVRLFGSKRSPQPFLYIVGRAATFKRDILDGVNFASAGCGILPGTGARPYGTVISLTDQIQQFATVRDNFTELIGPNSTMNMLADSLFIISIGSNDLFEYVEIPSNSSVGGFDDAFYIAKLQSTYRSHLEVLYKLGARKFGIVSVPPIGCTPHARVSNTSGVCRQELNDLAKAFFPSIKAMLIKMSLELKGMKYSLGHAYEMTMRIIEDPLAFGFKETQSACCGVGRLNGENGCCFAFNPKLCSNRREFLFWDFYHPSEYAAELAALTLYGGGTRYVTPMNFSQLLAA